MFSSPVGDDAPVVEARLALNKRLGESSWHDVEAVRSSVAFQLKDHALLKPDNADDGLPASGGKGTKLVSRLSDEINELLDDMRSAGSATNQPRSKTDWKMVEQTNMHRVLVRKDPKGGALDTLCVEGIFEGPIDAVLAMSRDIPFFKEWFPRVTIPTFYVEDAVCRKQVVDGWDMGLLTFKAPWPLPFHELATTFFTIYDPKTGVAVTTMRTLPSDDSDHDYVRDGYEPSDLPPQRKGSVRTRVDGGFILMDLGDGRCLFRGSFLLDIQIPAFFLNLITQKLGGALYELFNTEINTVLRGDDQVKRARFMEVLQSCDLYKRIRAGMEARQNHSDAESNISDSGEVIADDDTPSTVGSPNCREDEVYEHISRQLSERVGELLTSRVVAGDELSEVSEGVSELDDDVDRASTRSDSFGGSQESSSAATSVTSSPVSVLDLVRRSPGRSRRAGPAESESKRSTRKGWKQAFNLHRLQSPLLSATRLSPISSDDSAAMEESGKAALLALQASEGRVSASGAARDAAEAQASAATGAAAAAGMSLPQEAGSLPTTNSKNSPPTSTHSTKLVPSSMSKSNHLSLPQEAGSLPTTDSTNSPTSTHFTKWAPSSMSKSNHLSSTTRASSFPLPATMSTVPGPTSITTAAASTTANPDHVLNAPKNLSSGSASGPASREELRSRDPAMWQALATLDRAILALQAAQAGAGSGGEVDRWAALGTPSRAASPMALQEGVVAPEKTAGAHGGGNAAQALQPVTGVSRARRWLSMGLPTGLRGRVLRTAKR